MNTKAIYFDMDGTIANLYGVNEWLHYLQNGIAKPYREAKPLLNMRQLGKELNRLQAMGYIIGIVSWLSKNATPQYDEKVINAKRRWLKTHLGAVHWDELHFAKYGTPKSTVVQYPAGVLFDDEQGNRKEWNGATQDGIAFGVDNIITILEGIR